VIGNCSTRRWARAQLPSLPGNEPFCTVGVEAEAMVHARVTVAADIPLEVRPIQLDVRR